MVCLGIGVLVVVSIFLAPQVFPNGKHIEVKIVKSGSMEPAIKTGGIVTIRPVSEYKVGDVITFTSSGADIPTTHRIVGTEFLDGVTQFVTKGDANEERDTALVLPKDVVGKVLFTVPYLGFILDFARQPIGFGLLVGIPAFLIIFDEIDKIVREMRERRKKKLVLAEVPVQTAVPSQDPDIHARTMRMSDIQKRKEVPMYTTSLHIQPAGVATIQNPLMRHVQRLVLVTALCVGAVYLSMLGSTVSYFADIEAALANVLRTQALDFAVNAEGTNFVFNDAIPQDPGFVVVTTVTPETESVPLRYKVSTEFVSGTTTLCAALRVISTSPFGYEGNILGLGEAEVAFNNPWDVSVRLEQGDYVVGDVCVVDLVFHAWNSNFLIFDDGYDDDERVRLTFSIASSTTLGARMILISPTEEETFGEIINIEESASGIPEEGTTPAEEPPVSLIDGSNETSEKEKNDNNGHGNDGDVNDDSNPGNSNDESDTTDDDGSPKGTEGGKKVEDFEAVSSDSEGDTVKNEESKKEEQIPNPIEPASGGSSEGV
jgi:signal peptidase